MSLKTKYTEELAMVMDSTLDSMLIEKRAQLNLGTNPDELLGGSSGLTIGDKLDDKLRPGTSPGHETTFNKTYAPKDRLKPNPMGLTDPLYNKLRPEVARQNRELYNKPGAPRVTTNMATPPSDPAKNTLTTPEEFDANANKGNAALPGKMQSEINKGQKPAYPTDWTTVGPMPGKTKQPGLYNPNPGVPPRKKPSASMVLSKLEKIASYLGQIGDYKSERIADQLIHSIVNRIAK